MVTLNELRARIRASADAQDSVHEAHRAALNCLAYDDDDCLCDCGCRRKVHAIAKQLISARGHLIDKAECSECSCLRYKAAETLCCDYCGNTVRVGVDDDHCNDCSLLEVTDV